MFSAESNLVTLSAMHLKKWRAMSLWFSKESQRIRSSTNPTGITTSNATTNGHQSLKMTTWTVVLRPRWLKMMVLRTILVKRSASSWQPASSKSFCLRASYKRVAKSSTTFSGKLKLSVQTHFVYFCRGGIPSKRLIEVYGEAGTGKTQFAF